MLVPAMTLEEIRKEVEKDLSIVHRKSSYVSLKLARQYAGRLKTEKLFFYFNYYSKHKNTWMYLLTMEKKSSKTSMMVYYHGYKGITAIMPVEPDAMVYITSHFLNRYNERRKLNLVQPSDIIKAYMREVTTFYCRELEETAPGIFKVFIASDSGFPLGMYNKKLRLFKFNTFVTADMLHPDQRQLEEQLKEFLEKYKHGSTDLD